MFSCPGWLSTVKAFGPGIANPTQRSFEAGLLSGSLLRIVSRDVEAGLTRLHLVAMPLSSWFYK
jgi:hypothetical protein